MRVGDSFVADVNNFAQAVIYAVDNGVLVIQEALGTLNNTQLGAPGRRVRVRPRRRGDRLRRRRGRAAPQLALELPAHDRRQLGHQVRRGAHAASRAPTSSSTAAPTSRRRSRSRSRARAAPPTRPACGSGLAGLIYSAALNARDAGDLDDHPTCELVNGDPCVLSVNEVRQLMASGTVDAIEQVDDINFAHAARDRVPPAAAAGLHRQEPAVHRRDAEPAGARPRSPRRRATRPARATTSTTATGA